MSQLALNAVLKMIYLVFNIDECLTFKYTQLKIVLIASDIRLLWKFLINKLFYNAQAKA